MYYRITLCELILAKFFERANCHRCIEIPGQRQLPLFVSPAHSDDLLQVQASFTVINIIKNKTESKFFCHGGGVYTNHRSWFDLQG